MSTTAPSGAPVTEAPRFRPRPGLLTSRQGVVGLVLLCIVLGIALVGPLVAPHPLDLPIGQPGAPPSGAAPLGTDFLGRDVLSRVLYGGLPVLFLSVTTIAVTYLIGVTVGMSAGLSKSLLDPVLMRSVDIVLAFPALLLLLVLIAGLGTSTVVLGAGIVIVLVPGVARLVRTATLEVSTRAYIEVAVARGERTVAIMVREVLPNIAPALLADFGVRFSSAIVIAASVNFLGLGSRPPSANWGLMIAENRQIIGTNIWSVFAPAVLLALLTISVNMVSDAYLRGTGRSPRRRT
jgi:peptide/nickel transport system permease protein